MARYTFSRVSTSGQSTDPQGEILHQDKGITSLLSSEIDRGWDVRLKVSKTPEESMVLTYR